MEMFDKRNSDFMAVVEKMMREGAVANRPLTMGMAVRKALSGPAPKFYLTREHVWKKLLERRKMRVPPREKPHRRRMWEEIEQALRKRLEERPGESEWWALDHVLAHHRPSGFFITEEYARRLAYRAIHGQRERNRQTNRSYAYYD